MEGYEKELREVKEQLEDIEIQIETLLQTQSDLAARKEELELLIQTSSRTSTQSQSQAVSQKWDTEDFTWSAALKQKMKTIFKINELRPMQLQTMNVTLSGKDCILIMPTGGGKSLCFQLPALLSKGVTLVVSPLVSLMEDQVIALESYDVDAVMLNASTDRNKVTAVQNAMTDKNSPMKLLYVTPEKLAKSKRFMAKLEKMYAMGRFSHLVIDEVHCCSQWGHDFRPDYKFLGIMKRQFPEVPILGLTATATKNVIEDVKKILNIPSCILFKASFNRPNLFYEIKSKPSEHKEAMDEIQRLIQKRFNNQSGIIYCFSRKESQDVTADLRQRGIKTGCYHADLSSHERSRVHKMWLKDEIKVVVATTAFGMGIDKPDVRFVIHHSVSKSMENLYQESGRAGRDNKVSHCIVFYRLADIFRQSTMVFTEQTGLDNLYGIMAYCMDLTRCRRSVIAQHFGESWDRSDCKEMCDHCQTQAEIEKRDVKKHCQLIIEILKQASRLEERLTAIKLMDAFQGKKVGGFKVTGLDLPAVTRDVLERIISLMLIRGYLREDFHFTAYSTISYLIPGDKQNLLKCESTKVLLDCVQKRKPTKPNSASSVSHTNDKKKSEIPKSKSKPKLVIVKSQNSNNPGTNNGAVTEKPSVHKQLSLKRKKPIIYESEDSDLDFGEESTDCFVVKKRYVDSSANPDSNLNLMNEEMEKVDRHVDNTDSVGNSQDDAIQLDSDSND
ncbi:ATP-dependent DNA helicase Q1-like [Saccostrea echinata]|uniref:ATP-dependent DNA helicase Q1-like n=1 Tax=Saccostrea echinata TaxID=191078 RepID=UPI002A8312E3|nr:ATP-dependent DNA helicase Q1-like [Saccostrea echinata]